jgi:hypothetical protein
MTDPTWNKTWNKANPARYASSVWFKLVSTPSSQRSREFGNSLALDGSLDRTHNGHQWPNQTHASRQSKSKSTHVEARFQFKSRLFPHFRINFYTFLHHFIPFQQKLESVLQLVVQGPAFPPQEVATFPSLSRSQLR